MLAVLNTSNTPATLTKLIPQDEWSVAWIALLNFVQKRHRKVAGVSYEFFFCGLKKSQMRRKPVDPAIFLTVDSDKNISDRLDYYTKPKRGRSVTISLGFEQSRETDFFVEIPKDYIYHLTKRFRSEHNPNNELQPYPVAPLFQAPSAEVSSFKHYLFAKGAGLRTTSDYFLFDRFREFTQTEEQLQSYIKSNNNCVNAIETGLSIALNKAKEMI